MKQILLTQNKVALVDDQDFLWLWLQSPWCCQKGYAGRAERGKGIIMHRVIAERAYGPSRLFVDHKDRNTLNNQRDNLRYATSAQQKQNSISRTGRSKYKGVTWNSSALKWVAAIRHNGLLQHLGVFDNEITAALAYDEKAIELFGEFARLNFPLEQSCEAS